MAHGPPEGSLDDLLNDALADFDKKPEQLIPVAAEKGTGDTQCSRVQNVKDPHVTNQEGASGGSTNMAPPTDIFNQFFDKDMTEKLQEEWESAMKELMEDDQELASQIKSIPTMLDSAADENLPSEGASTSQRTEDKKPLNLEEAMKATISGMKQTTDELKNMTSASAEEKLLRDMKNMGLGGMGDMMGQAGEMEGFENNFITMMEGMMKNLLSKDILYPTMKHISGVYPSWLESKKATIQEADYNRFKRQSVVMVKICKNFESEEESDSDEVKKKRLNDLMNLVEEMQECGNPPPELLDGYGSPVDAAKIFGNAPPEGQAFNPGDMNPDNCIVM